METVKKLLLITITFLVVYEYFIKNKTENFWPGYPWFNIPSRNFKYRTTDIRGEANLVFYGNEPIGYLFGPYMYDYKGNFIKFNNGNFFIR